MRNDDPEYVDHLEAALADAEKEIKWLEIKLATANEALYAAHIKATPTFMGEPLLTISKSQLDTAWEKVEAAEADKAARKFRSLHDFTDTHGRIA